MYNSPIKLFIRHQKALIYTWLAWQEKPGRPMGQAITNHYLKHNSETVKAFTHWLSTLF
ncbi:MAG: DUF3226 domain-containing protein [Microcystaceae cyanobacterium]